MPLLSRNKSLPGSAASQTTAAAAAANSKQQPLVCESPLFGLRRQLPVSCGMSSPEETVGTTRQSHSNQRQTVSAKNSSALTSALKSRYTDLCSASSSSASTSSSTNANTTTKTAAAAAADTMVSIPKQITRQQIHYAFSIMDTNSDGLIDVRDLSQTLANLGVPIDEAILSHVMSTVSKRGDHLISEQEFLRWIGNFIQVSDLPEAGGAAAAPTAQQLTGSGKRSAARGNGPSGSMAAARSGQGRVHSAVARSSSTSSPSNSSSSPSSSSSLLAQSIEAEQLIGQQMRQRRGSGSGLALMRSLSSQSSSPSTSTSATAAANSQQHNLSKADSNQRDTTALTSNNQQQQQAELQQEARDDLKAAFCVFDLDGDGYITIDEVQQGLKLLGESWSQAELNQLLFSKCDPNNNSTGASGVIKSGKTLGKRMDLSMAKQPQQQRISIEDFVKLLL